MLQDVTMESYIKLLMEHKVSHLVCATDQAYKTEDLTKSGSNHTPMLELSNSVFFHAQVSLSPSCPSRTAPPHRKRLSTNGSAWSTKSS